MTTNNPSDAVNLWSPLSEEMERTLRRLAWKDEIFREALIADPKAVIHYLFHQSLPDGKLPDDLTIKVVEQDPSTHHIVLPAFADEEPTLEIPEEEQLDLIVNLGLEGKRPRESDESQRTKEAKGQRKHSYTETQFRRRDQAKEIGKQQEQTKETKVPTPEELAKALSHAMHHDEKIA